MRTFNSFFNVHFFSSFFNLKRSGLIQGWLKLCFRGFIMTSVLQDFSVERKFSMDPEALFGVIKFDQCSQGIAKSTLFCFSVCHLCFCSPRSSRSHSMSTKISLSSISILLAREAAFLADDPDLYSMKAYLENN